MGIYYNLPMASRLIFGAGATPSNQSYYRVCRVALVQLPGTWVLTSGTKVTRRCLPGSVWPRLCKGHSFASPGQNGQHHSMHELSIFRPMMIRSLMTETHGLTMFKPYKLTWSFAGVAHVLSQAAPGTPSHLQTGNRNQTNLYILLNSNLCYIDWFKFMNRMSWGTGGNHQPRFHILQRTLRSKHPEKELIEHSFLICTTNKQQFIGWCGNCWIYI